MTAAAATVEADAEPASAAELARLVGRDRERLRGSFRALVERGLAVADSVDPEQARWSVTPAGRLMLDRLGEARREGITDLLADWSPEMHPTSCG
jgi:predicted transcriptional regulator